MTDIDPKAIDAAVKAMEKFIKANGHRDETLPWKICRTLSFGRAITIEEFAYQDEQDRSLARIKARAAIEAYLEFMREKEESASA